MALLLTPDDVLVRQFGFVRAVGAGAYVVAVWVLFGMFGAQVWPLALGVPVLAVVTTWYFRQSPKRPRAAIVVSLLADALVLGGAIAFVGGTGSGMVMVYAIVIVSGGLLLGPAAARAFTVLALLLGGGQLAVEELGFAPALLHRPDLGERAPILLLSLATLASVGYLTATYASRLHELIAEAGERAEDVRVRGRRRRRFVAQAAREAVEPLRELEAVAGALEGGRAQLTGRQRAALAERLRICLTRLDAEVGLLTDAAAMDAGEDVRPEPVLLSRVVGDVLAALGDRLGRHRLDVRVPPMKVVGSRRAARRVVYSLLENVAEHTPPGTRVRVEAVVTAGHGVLVVTDDGPGIPADVAAEMFDAPEGDGGDRLGLPLVSDLCAGMGAACRYEPAPSGGARFVVSFRLAPSATPTSDDEPVGGRTEAGP